MSHEQVKDILTKYKIVVIVGLSRDLSKRSYVVADYLAKHGFTIIPINPFTEEVMDLKSYRSLRDVPIEIQKTIEIVDIFRSSGDVPPIVD